MSKRRKQVRSAAGSASFGWDWAHAALWSDGRKCLVRMTDTVIFQDEDSDLDSVLWLFTGKSGAISRKRMLKDGTIPVTKIRERFLQQSRLNAGTNEDYVAVMVFRDGTRQLVGLHEFDEFLRALDDGKRAGDFEAWSKKEFVKGLQAFIPTRDELSHIAVQFEAAKSNYIVQKKAGYFDGESTELTLSPGLRKEVEHAAATIVNYLSEVKVSSALFEFVVDSSERLWLTHMSRVTLQAKPSSNSALPNLQTSGIAGDNVAKCRGEFCQSSLASLSGLSRLVKVFNTSDLNNSLDRIDDGVLKDSGQRFKMGNNNLMLAHAELDFLREATNVSPSQLSDSDLALQWQEADNVFRMELGRSNPNQFYKQVLVCANCHRVYSEINKVRDKGFAPRSASVEQSVETTADENRSDLYDKMFLDELANHSSPRAKHHGPEQDESLDRPSSGSASPRKRSMLPSLPGLLSDQKNKKNIRKGSEISNGQGNQQSSTTSLSNNEQLAGKVTGLEAELAQVKQKLATVQTKRNKLEQDILQTRSQCTAMLKEKDDQARKQLLELEYSFHSKQSISKPQAENQSSSADEMTHLIETIDSLNAQLDQANKEKDLTKKQLVQSHQIDLKKLHEKYQLDMETLRLSEHSAKEQVENFQMQMLSLQSQAQVATTQAKNARASLEDLTKNKVVALEEKNQRLERQLAALKIQQRNLGQTSSGMLNMVANSSSVPQQDVEAMEKHLNNKIEYLKAQLASEMKCKEELGSHLAQITNAMEQMKKEKRQALAEQEEAFKRQTERMESAFIQEKEVLTTQQASLQGKLVTLQANVTDLVQELTLWKSKEANAKLAMEKMVEENVRLTRQLVDAEGQVESLQEERKQDAAKAGSISVMNASEETKRVQMEALLRRLDNERQYLKSQLEGQQEMKEKSQKQVSDLQYEIRELKDAMEEALRTSEKTISELKMDKQNHEQELRGTIECLEQGKLLLARQLKDIQTKFAEAREQSLLERDEIEKARIEVNEMRGQLLAAKEDSVKEQAYAKSASERMSKSLAVVKNSLKAMEEEKNKQVKRLEGENTEYIRKLAATQGDMLVLEEKFTTDKAQAKKDKATAIFALVLAEKAELWRLRSEHRGFTHLKILAKLSRQQHLVDTRRSEELAVIEDKLREEYMAKCDEMTQTLHDERLEAIKQMKEAHDKDREELNEFYLQEKSQLEEELTAIHTAQMKQIKEQYASLSKSAEDNADSTIQELSSINSTLQKNNAKLTEEMAELTQKCEAMSSSFEDELSALKQDWEAKHESWTTEHAELRSKVQTQQEKHEEQLTFETSKLVSVHAQDLEQLQSRHEKELAEQAKQFVEQVAMVSEEQSQRYNVSHASISTTTARQHQTEMEEAVAKLTEHWQGELDQLRLEHEHALKDAVTQAEEKANAQLESLQKEMNERKGTAVVKCTSKWQKAMEELQERQHVEKKMAYNEGLQDREKEWQQAATQIKEKQREEMDKVQQEALAAIRAAEERHEIRFQAQLAEIKSQLEEQHQQSIQELTDEITAQERERAQEHLDATTEVLEQELTAKWMKQLKEQTNQFESKLHDEEARLSAVIEEKETELRKLRDDFDNQLAELEKSWTDKLTVLSASTASAHELAINTLRGELISEHNAALKQLQEHFVNRLESQLHDQETRLLREQEDAITQVQDDSEKLIEQVERAMNELKKQKEHLESELNSLRSALEEAEDAQFDAQENFKKQQKQTAFHVLHLISCARKKIADESQRNEVSRTEFETKCRQLQDDFTSEKTQWKEVMTRVHDTWTQVQSQHGEMNQTLTNYRRDELVAHRSTSAVLSNEISIVTKQLEEVEEMKITLERDVEALQTEAHSVEAALRDLMQQSSGNSSLNMAVVAKKRRLNEEFEALLERIEKKKNEVATVEQTLSSLRFRREEKEHEMRQMERKLVEILVQQQKQMLQLVSTVREISLPTSAT